MTGRSNVSRVMLSLLLCLAACGPIHGAPPATTQETKAAAFKAAAEEVTQYIQKTYFDSKTGLYAHSLDDHDPEAMWGNGVMLSALVAAAKQQPGIYRPIVSRFFVSLDGYWDTEAPL